MKLWNQKLQQIVKYENYFLDFLQIHFEFIFALTSIYWKIVKLCP